MQVASHGLTSSSSADDGVVVHIEIDPIPETASLGSKLMNMTGECMVEFDQSQFPALLFFTGSILGVAYFAFTLHPNALGRGSVLPDILGKLSLLFTGVGAGAILRELPSQIRPLRE